MRQKFVIISSALLIAVFLLAWFLGPNWYVVLAIIAALVILGYYDMFQKKHAVMRIFPVLGRLRYLMEELRPKIYQYFIESDIDGRPINRIDRSTIYQRAKKENDTMPFGTQLDVYTEGYEWLCHSIAPKDFSMLDHDPRVLIGNKDCKQPYSCSIYNISAMSYGSLSANAVEAMNAGAKIGGFAHNTGEGGLTPHHLKHGGDIIWQIGTGYFGCRTADGNFSPEAFRKKAATPQVKMIEIKISQGAKPGHGGILPASKNTPEIAAIRGIEPHTLVASPPYHKAFDTPRGLVMFVKQLRELADGKPIGFKLCIGHKSEFIGICKAMMELNIFPDFITVDGAEGGTGAAPQEFSNYVGAPLLDGLAFVHNMLVGLDIRHHIKILASGKITTGFHIIRAIALGADACYSARAMMMAVGCIQALLCNTNKCPTGVATQDPKLTVGLVVEDKKTRVANFHKGTVESVVELLGASGLDKVSNVTRSHIYRRISFQSMLTYREIFPEYETGSFLKEIPERYKLDFDNASPDHWGIAHIGSWSRQRPLSGAH
ncbi:MAG: FMN-binding glutamate synthase family protein [Saprospiraceae bacterium]|nr:FMN-binding glutamate synthase family protein [Saprospiraceae bacterium]MBX7178815.1 FMN-binding glutamate synthase family protein [Saprospiraceae bacterium]MCB0590308.1 FMN-binding glutamate synthase family protein [Saprospiraceae bacterium]MCO5282563.1 FMN-binding glutamate synthase family protein [Saprospiraceae bacterium]MCO6470503.1 FMN-binding glutamate synthase family protein [Saprospiraceae bacterium]